MRIDAAHQNLESTKLSAEKTRQGSNDVAAQKGSHAPVTALQPELHLRVAALLNSLPDEPPIRADRVREVASKLANGDYETELAARQAATAILKARFETA